MKKPSVKRTPKMAAKSSKKVIQKKVSKNNKTLQGKLVRNVKGK